MEDLEKRVDRLEKEQEQDKKVTTDLVKDVMRFWHIATGVGLGLVIDKFGLDKIISKIL